MADGSAGKSLSGSASRYQAEYFPFYKEGFLDNNVRLSAGVVVKF